MWFNKKKNEGCQCGQLERIKLIEDVAKEISLELTTIKLELSNIKKELTESESEHGKEIKAMRNAINGLEKDLNKETFMLQLRMGVNDANLSEESIMIDYNCREDRIYLIHRDVIGQDKLYILDDISDRYYFDDAMIESINETEIDKKYLLSIIIKTRPLDSPLSETYNYIRKLYLFDTTAGTINSFIESEMISLTDEEFSDYGKSMHIY